MVLPVKGMPLHAYQGAPPEDLQEVRIPELYAHQGVPPEDPQEGGNGLERLYHFKQYRIASKWEGAFNVGRRFKLHKKELPLEPKSIRELQNHPLKDSFMEAQRQHLAEH